MISIERDGLEACALVYKGRKKREARMVVDGRQQVYVGLQTGGSRCLENAVDKLVDAFIRRFDRLTGYSVNGSSSPRASIPV